MRQWHLFISILKEGQLEKIQLQLLWSFNPETNIYAPSAFLFPSMSSCSFPTENTNMNTLSLNSLYASTFIANFQDKIHHFETKLMTLKYLFICVKYWDYNHIWHVLGPGLSWHKRLIKWTFFWHCANFFLTSQVLFYLYCCRYWRRDSHI